MVDFENCQRVPVMETVDFTMARVDSVMPRCSPTEVLFKKVGRLLKEAPVLSQFDDFSLVGTAR